jgi:hypothetical protein
VGKSVRVGVVKDGVKEAVSMDDKGDEEGWEDREKVMED